MDETKQRVDADEVVAHAPRSGQALITAWLLSLTFHAACLGAMFLVVFPLAGNNEPPEVPVVNVQVVGDVDAVPTRLPARQSPANSMGGIGLSSDTAPRFTPSAPAGAERMERIAPAGGGKGPDLSIIGIGSEGGFGGGGEGPPGLSLEGGGGGGPEFFGVGASAPGARSIVYVVDRSGSMVDTFHRVRAELKRSITALRRSQKFHVIFFNAAAPLENPPQRPVNAINAHKEQFFAFLDGVTPGGGTKPESAMARALALEPDIVYFLSDGVFEASLLQKLDQWNPQRHTRIYTIAYLDQTGRQVLETIAREHGGEFKFVSEHDLP